MHVRKKVSKISILLAPCLLFAAASTLSAQLEPRRILEIEGEAPEDYDVSAVVAKESYLVWAVDEGTSLQILEAKKDGRYRTRSRVPLRTGDDEIDLEGLARDGDTFYAVGSHSSKRKTLKPGKSSAENRERLATVEAEPSRDGLFRLRLDLATGEIVHNDELSLRQILEDDEILRRFSDIPSKENGIDIEGIAAASGRLYLGFRGPVLRGGYTPVMVLDFDAPTEYELRFVHLDGRGIRGMARVDGGFLILAGPVGDSDLSYRLYAWDGKDCVPGEDREEPPCHTIALGAVPVWADSKAEGLAVLGQTSEGIDILVVYDGAPKGNPTLFRVANPLILPPPS